MEGEGQVKKKLNFPTDLNLWADYIEDELGIEQNISVRFSHIGTKLPLIGNTFVEHKEIEMEENKELDEVMEQVHNVDDEKTVGEVLFNGMGPDFRIKLKEHNYELKLGVTNRMIERYALDAFSKMPIQLNYLSEDNVSILGELLVGINYAEKVQTRVEKQVENTSTTNHKVGEIEVNKESSTVQPETSEEIGYAGTDEEHEAFEEENKEVIPISIDKGKKQTRLSANNRWMDGVDFSILLLRSAQWAFILVMVGVIGQAFHVYHVVANLSDLSGWAKVANSLLWAVFLSFGLVYFTLKRGVVSITDKELLKKYTRVVNWFIAFDIFANLYYWAYKFVLSPAVLDKYLREFTGSDGNTYTDIDWGAVDWMTFDITKVQWPQMIAGMVFALSIPFILKAFAGEINLPKLLDNVFRSYKLEEKEN